MLSQELIVKQIGSKGDANDAQVHINVCMYKSFSLVCNCHIL